jgi:hypothetical protein
LNNQEQWRRKKSRCKEESTMKNRRTDDPTRREEPVEREEPRRKELEEGGERSGDRIFGGLVPGFCLASNILASVVRQNAGDFVTDVKATLTSTVRK